MKFEPHHGGGAHLNGGDATLGVALGEVAVSRRVKGAIHIHRYQQPRALGELLGVYVSTVFPGRNRTQPLFGDGASRRDRIFRVG